MIAQAKQIRALLQNQPVRHQKQEARVELRKRIRDHGIALTERMDHERTLNMRADTPLTARVAADMGGAPPPPQGAPAPKAKARPARAAPALPPPPAGIGDVLNMLASALLDQRQARGARRQEMYSRFLD